MSHFTTLRFLFLFYHHHRHILMSTIKKINSFMAFFKSSDTLNLFFFDVFIVEIIALRISYNCFIVRVSIY